MKKFRVRRPFYIMNLEKWFWTGDIITEDDPAYEILRHLPEMLDEEVKEEKPEEKRNERKKKAD
ncbi:MAG: hypothetical protein WBJ87_02625 [Candidatus Hydrothermia bacterium]